MPARRTAGVFALNLVLGHHLSSACSRRMSSYGGPLILFCVPPPCLRNSARRLGKSALRKRYCAPAIPDISAQRFTYFATASPHSSSLGKLTAKKPHLTVRAEMGDQVEESKPVARRAVLRAVALVAASVVATAVVPTQPADALSKKRILAKAGPELDLGNGIQYRDISVGKGYTPQKGDTVAVHYSLFYNDLEVESSRESQGLAASPIGFTYGAERGPGAVMKGLDLGIAGMKVGGLRLIYVPAKYAYGEKGRPPLIPPRADVELAVSLLSCKRVGSNPNMMINPNAQVY